MFGSSGLEAVSARSYALNSPFLLIRYLTSFLKNISFTFSGWVLCNRVSSRQFSIIGIQKQMPFAVVIDLGLLNLLHNGITDSIGRNKWVMVRNAAVMHSWHCFCLLEIKMRDTPKKKKKEVCVFLKVWRCWADKTFF